jgi:hypothetical protein
MFMSRLNAPGPASSRPTVNVYTGLAFISMAATLGTLIFLVMKFMDMGIFK